jgi:Tol biopolymer transport system component
VLLDAVAQVLTAGSTDDITGAGQFAVSLTGTLAWVPGKVVPYPDAALVTVDRRGQVTPLRAPVRSYSGRVCLSPDGRRLAVTVQGLTEVGLWGYDFDRGNLLPLDQSGEVDTPVWERNGQRILFQWLKDGRLSIAAQPADGSTAPQVVVPGGCCASSVTPDGRHLAMAHDGDIVLVTMADGKARVEPPNHTPETEVTPEFSPDGRWLAYTSNVSKQGEVYVRPFPGPGRVEAVSIEGGFSPAWHPNGRELFFLDSRPDRVGQQQMMAVAFDPGPPPRIGRPTELFSFSIGDLGMACYPVRCFDVARDGQRFYAVQRVTPPPTPPVTHINLVENWFEELKAKVPTTR